MNMFRKEILVTAVAAALGVGAIGNAHAGAKAFASQIISNFVMVSDGTPIDVGDFSVIEVTDTLETSAFLGLPGEVPDFDNGFDMRSVSTPGPLDPPPALGIADAPMACVGPDCGAIGENSFTQQDLDGDGLATLDHFARGDARLEGAIISGTDQDPGALAELVAGVQLNETAVGGGNAVITNTTEFTFSLDGDGGEIGVAFEFGAEVLLEVLLEQDETFATAGSEFSLTIRNLELTDDPLTDVDERTIFSFAPNGVVDGTETDDPFNLNSEIGTLSIVPDTFSDSGFFRSVASLPTNTDLALSIVSSTVARAQAIEVPEPATLALFGAGLLGIGAVSRRRQAKA